MPHLEIVVASTRPGRIGSPIARWFHDAARAHAGFDAALVELADVALPLLDEPKHPRFGQYEHAHTKAWSARVAAADAFVFVTPEYNFGAPAPLVNAIDYLFREWHYKPCAFVSYGGLSGGTRSVQMSKMIVTTLRMMPIPEAVTIPMVPQHMKDGAFVPTDVHAKSANGMLDELLRWSNALAPLRT
jgi:NAD(P)H-dependent FMN reductase